MNSLLFTWVLQRYLSMFNGGKACFQIMYLYTKGPSTIFYFSSSSKPRQFPLQSCDFLSFFVEKNALVTDYSPQLTLSLCMTTEEQALTLQHTLTVLGTKTALVSIWTLLILCHWAPCLIPCASSETANAGWEHKIEMILISVGVNSWGPSLARKSKAAPQCHRMEPRQT